MNSPVQRRVLPLAGTRNANDLFRFSQPVVAGVSRFLTRSGKLCRSAALIPVTVAETEDRSTDAREVAASGRGAIHIEIRNPPPHSICLEHF
jgi:hypothetical protein